MDNIKLDRIPCRIKWKMPVLYFKLWRCIKSDKIFITSFFISCCITSAESFFTTFRNLIQNYLKKIFVTKFPFLMDSPKPKPTPLAVKFCYKPDKSFLFMLPFFNWDSLHARLSSHCKTWSYKKKKPTVKGCLLILDLKPFRS